jgi:hypothetical protein
VAHYLDAPKEALGTLPPTLPELLTYPSDVAQDEVQSHNDGAGPMFHRRYSSDPNKQWRDSE